MGVEASQRVGAVAGGEVASEVADVQAGRAFVAQARRVAQQRREDGAGLVGRQELLRLLAGHEKRGKGRAEPGLGSPQPAAMRRRSPAAPHDEKNTNKNRLRLQRRPAAGSGFC